MSTVLGAVFRTVIVALVFLAFLGFSPSLGFSFPETAKTIAVMNRAVYDFSLALYTVPLGYFFAYCLKLLTESLS